MSDWVESDLRELVSFQKGRKVEVSDYPRDQFAPYLGAGVLAGGEITEFADTRGAVLADQNDMLMLWDGERSGLVGHGQIGVVSSTVSKLTQKGRVTSKFLYYSLDAQFPYIQNQRIGTGVPHVPKDLGRILKIKFPVSEDQQQHISEILTTVDEAIEHTEALIAKTQQIKASLMHDLFTRGVTPDGRLRPPREDAPQLYKESPLGWIPKEWAILPLNKLADIRPSNVDKKSNLGEQPVRLCNYMDVYSCEYVTEDIEFMEATATAAEVQRFCIERGDVLITKDSETPDDIGIPAAVIEQIPNLVCGYHVALIKPKRDEVDPIYLAKQLETVDTARYFGRLANGSTRYSLSSLSIANTPIRLAPLPQQQRIAKILTTVDEAIEHTEALITKKQQIKAGLMHDLLTGRIRVMADAWPEPTEVTANV